MPGAKLGNWNAEVNKTKLPPLLKTLAEGRKLTQRGLQHLGIRKEKGGVQAGISPRAAWRDPSK